VRQRLHRIISRAVPAPTAGGRVSPTILCLTSYEKGQEFMRACAAEGARTLLLTVETLRDAPWPRDVLADVFLLPTFDETAHVVNAVSYLARTEHITRIVALDEFDMELAALLREHLRVPGMDVTTTRGIRDKLAMREIAAGAGITVPAFSRVVHHGELDVFLHGTQAPWLLKPRTQASAIGIRKIEQPQEVWPILDALGDMQSHYLIERYIPGDVYHVDGLVVDGELCFAEVNRYSQPPFDTMHAGGIFCTATVPRGSDDERALREETARLVRAVNVRNSAFHAEYIRAHDSGAFNFLEIAARVGGAHIAEMVEAATNLNLWREWARLELALVRGARYELPALRADHSGVLISLARQEWPDTSAYDDPEIVWRLNKLHHAGLIVRSSDAERVRFLLQQYMERFRHEFHASLPAPERATN
jgi:biotin carboxylase